MVNAVEARQEGKTMKNQVFKAEQFRATKWETAEDKAKFANHLVRFINSGYNPNLFYDWFYRRLSMTFGHIAHFNRHGFYDVWFTGRESRREFIHHLMMWPCYGDPEYTYSDVEKALQQHFNQ
jgi:hypothetical protein